jgi:hypothetical protein
MSPAPVITETAIGSVSVSGTATAGAFAAFAFAAKSADIRYYASEQIDIPVRFTCNGLKKPLSDAIAL